MIQNKIFLFSLVFFLLSLFFTFAPESNALLCDETNQTCRDFNPYIGDCAVDEQKIGLCEGIDIGKNCCEKLPILACDGTNQICRLPSGYGTSCLESIEKKIGLCGDSDSGKDCCEKIATVPCTGDGESCQGEGTYGYCDSGDTKVGLCTSGEMCCKKASSSAAPPATASLDYTPLEAIPGQGTPSDFPTYVKAIYTFGIFAVGIAALLMVMIGGFIYVTAAGNTSQVEKGKEFIKDALVGIVVAFGSWLILYVINPDLVNINLDSLRKLTMTSGGATYGPTPGGSTPPGEPVKTGDCSGYHLSGPTCSLLSSEIQAFLKCLRTAVPSEIPMTLTSITSNASGSSLEKSAFCCGHGKNPGGGCPHSSDSCHHGCKTPNKGYSYAVDIAMTAGDKNYCTIATAAKNCNALEALGPKTECGVTGASGHESHFHFSAGCD